VDVADALVWNHLRAAITDPAFLREQAARWLAEQEKRQQEGDQGPSAISIAQALKSLQSEEARYARAYGRGDLTEQVFQTLASEIRGKREELQRKQQMLPSSAENKPLPSVEELVQWAIAGASRLNYDDRQRVVGLLVEKVVLDRDGATVTGHFPLLSGQDGSMCPGQRVAIETNVADSHGMKRTQIAANLPFTLAVKLPQFTGCHRFLQSKIDTYLRSVEAKANLGYRYIDS
jgi:hypothetical protein